MSRFFSSKYDKLIPYTPGEQPKNMEYVKLNTNESPFPPSQKAQKYACEMTESLQLYSDPELLDLVKIASEHFGVEKDEILFTNGSDEILNFAFMAFCDKNKPAIFPDITYGFYPVFADVNNIPYEKIPLTEDFRINVEDYIEKNKTIFIANPNAPTGIALTAKEIEKIVSSNPESVVVIDEAYVDFGAESVIPLIHKYDNLLVTQTFSKSCSMAGARLGFGIGSKALIQDLNTIKYSTNPYNVNRMTMAAGIGTLEDYGYIKNNCLEIQEIRRWTEKELKNLGFVMTESLANFIFVRHPEKQGKKLYLTLKQKGILVRHFDTPRLKDYLRITIGSHRQMEILVSTLKDILEEI